MKAHEALDAIRHGADEVDMVVNLGMVKDGCWGDVLEDIRQVRKASARKILKVIIETCVLTEQEKIQLCAIVSASGADYIKTSTGFSTGGATFEDVELLRRYCDPRVKIKAAGGISTLEEAERFLALGADRLGSSRIVKLAIEQEKQAAEQAELLPEPDSAPEAELSEPAPAPETEPPVPEAGETPRRKTNRQKE